jgi:hypothetical protein
MIVGIEAKEPPRTLRGRPRPARLSLLETEIIDFFVQISRLLGHPCKIYNILNVGAPVLYIGPRLSHLSELLEGIEQEHPCAGAVMARWTGWCARSSHLDDNAPGPAGSRRLARACSFPRRHYCQDSSKSWSQVNVLLAAVLTRRRVCLPYSFAYGWRCASAR